MNYLNGVRCIVTDIEGTTTSISFVLDVFIEDIDFDIYIKPVLFLI